MADAIVKKDVSLKHKQQHPKVYMPYFVWCKSARSGETV